MSHDHSGHTMPMPMPDHGGHNMPMPADCAMEMLWNTRIADTCVVFRQWHISTTAGLIASMAAIVALGVLYEWLRTFQGTVDRRIARRLLAAGKAKARGGSTSGRDTPEMEEDTTLLGGVRASFKAGAGAPVPMHARAMRASLYGATIFLSFFLMLVFMTYNAYLISAVVVGAALGHYIFSPTMDVDAVLSGGASGKGMACH